MPSNASDQDRFLAAQQQIAREERVAEGIATMIHLSWYAQPPHLRVWAARYLEQTLNTSIERDDDHEATGTTSPFP